MRLEMRSSDSGCTRLSRRAFEDWRTVEVDFFLDQNGFCLCHPALHAGVGIGLSALSLLPLGVVRRLGSRALRCCSCESSMIIPLLRVADHFLNG